MEKVKLSMNNPSAETVVEAARKAIVEDKIYNFEVVDSEGYFMMSVNGYENNGNFANFEICNLWRKLCECERLWDEFYTKYPRCLEKFYNDVLEDGEECVEIKEDNE